jgi:hypothetical protein
VRDRSGSGVSVEAIAARGTITPTLHVSEAFVNAISISAENDPKICPHHYCDAAIAETPLALPRKVWPKL